MDTALRHLLTGLAQAEEYITPDGLEPDQYDAATADRAIEAGLAQLDLGNGWDTVTRLRLTRAGRVAIGLPVPNGFVERVRAWFGSTTHGR